MNTIQKQELVSLLQTHVDDIRGLRYKNYDGAESLYQRTKMLASKYFPGRAYGMDLVGLGFRVRFSSIESEEDVWTSGIEKLSSISQAMLDDVKLTAIQHPTVKVVENTTEIEYLRGELARCKEELLSRQRKFKIYKQSLWSAILLMFTSVILWSFNSIVKWHWLSVHPRRVSVYLAFQLLLLLIHLRIISSGKTIRTAETIAIAVAVLIGILALI